MSAPTQLGLPKTLTPALHPAQNEPSLPSPQTSLPHHDMPTDENLGFFSQLISAAKAMSSPEERAKAPLIKYTNTDGTLRVPGSIAATLAASSNAAPNGAPAAPSANSAQGTLPTHHSQLLASDIRFEPVHSSPLNTIGNGDLQLLHFDEKHVARPASEVLPVPVENGVSTGNRLSVVASNARSVTRTRSPGRASRDEESADASLVSSDNSHELEEVLEATHIKFASLKKNKEFHHVFKKIPSGERLIEDISCALSKDILVHGKMYLSEHYICFNSNILGWVTNLCIPLNEVIQIEKKLTAVLFPNGLVIHTLHQKYVFATFLSRDATFDLITRMWQDVLQLGHLDPVLKARHAALRNRGRLTATRQIVLDLDSSDELSDLEDELGTLESPSRRTSMLLQTKDESDDGEEKDSEEGGFANPGPAQHAPTLDDYEKESNDVDILEHNFKAPLGVVVALLFGADGSHMAKVLEDQKNFDVEKDKLTDITGGTKERAYTYIKPLSGPIGPKQTKCHITDKLVHADYEKYVHVEQQTQTPDVPSGNAFKIATKLLFAWGANNSTDMRIITLIEWLGKSWIKGTIEKASIDGQKESMKLLVETVEDVLALGAGGAKKKRRKSKSVSRRKLEDEEPQPEPPKEEPTLAGQAQQFVECIGRALPVQIAVLGDFGCGLLVLLLALLLYTWVCVRLFRGKAAPQLEIQPEDGLFGRLVKLRNNRYFMVPTLQLYLDNRNARVMHEASLWNWIKDRSGGKLQLQEGTVESHVTQEFEELVRIAKRRMDMLHQQLVE